MEKASLAKIASKVGVSKTVVYTVLNNRMGKGIHVSNATKDKIIQTAKKMNYFPPKSAKEFSTGKSRRIGVFFSHMIQPFSDLVVKIQQECSQNNYEIIPYITGHNTETETQLLETFRDSRVDGIIALGGGPDNLNNYKKYVKEPCNYKILYYGNASFMDIADKLDSTKLPLIHFNGEKAGALAAEHLIKTNCRKLAFLGSYYQSSREIGFSEFSRNKAGIEPLILINEKKFFDSNATKELIGKLFERKNLPEGIFTVNDFIAMSLMFEAQARRLKIPEDISIIGCDNTILCNYTSPELTSINTNISEIAEKAVSIMLAMINGETNIPDRTFVDVSISIRKTTKQ